MNRLFTFGCSFTKYEWVMWPEILKDHYKPDYYENNGVCGAGNQYISHQVAVANEKHKFTSDDTVIICWTHVCRKDWYIPNGHNIDDNHEIPGPNLGWECMGNVWNADDKLNSHLPTDLMIPSDFLAMSALCIYNTIKLLNEMGVPNIHFQLTHTFQTAGTGEAETFLPEEYDNEQITYLTNYCNQYLKPSFFETISVTDTWNNLLPGFWQNDYHPMPLDSMKYLESVLDIKCSEQTRDKLSRCQEYVVEQFKSNPELRTEQIFHGNDQAMHLENFS